MEITIEVLGVGKAFRRIVGRPDLWVEATRWAWSHRRRHWWSSSPYLPVPDPDHLAWRVATAYGSSRHPLELDDVEAYLEWRRTWRRAS